MASTDNTTWYNDPRNLHLLAQYLVDQGADAQELLEMLDKPWHWDAEFASAYAGVEGQMAAAADLKEARTL